jgi:hypothetical protein
MITEGAGATWMLRFPVAVKDAGDHALWFILLPAAVWGLFEWRVRSENKSLMRMAALGTTAVCLMAVVKLMAGSLAIPFCLGVPAVGRMARPWAVQQVTTAQASVRAMEQAQAKNDWAAMQEHTSATSNALTRLSSGPAISALVKDNVSATVDELRAQVSGARLALADAQRAIREKDERLLAAALKRFHDSYNPVEEAARTQQK